jgi:RNA polymerase sigma-70 factor (ECF subfamily)
MTDLRDEDLARRAQGGDVPAFGVLVERYGPKLRRYARKFLLGHEDAEDQVQEAFLRAYVNVRSFDATRAFSPWIYRIAHNQFINAIKKRGREPVSFVDLDALLPHLSAPDDPRRDAERAEVRALLDRGMDGIAPKYREPLVLYYFEELDYRQIAEVLRIPTSTVGVRLLRGKEALRKAVTAIDPTPYGHA